jgi:flagellin
MSVINTNITSMIGQSNLNKSQNALQTSMERLSSGLRINSAKDDAAGQAIANRMTAQITGLAQAQRNANDGISVAQTAEGALNQVNDNLQRIRELTTQAQNGTNSESDLESIQNEIGQRLNEINRISEETSFNGVKVLASDQGLKIQVGANDGEAIDINLKSINAETLGVSSFNVTDVLKGKIGEEAITALGEQSAVAKPENQATTSTAKEVTGVALYASSGSATGFAVLGNDDQYYEASVADSGAVTWDSTKASGVILEADVDTSKELTNIGPVADSTAIATGLGAIGAHSTALEADGTTAVTWDSGDGEIYKVNSDEGAYAVKGSDGNYYEVTPTLSDGGTITNFSDDTATFAWGDRVAEGNIGDSVDKLYGTSGPAAAIGDDLFSTPIPENNGVFALADGEGYAVKGTDGKFYEATISGTDGTLEWDSSDSTTIVSADDVDTTEAVTRIKVSDVPADISGLGAGETLHEIMGNDGKATGEYIIKGQDDFGNTVYNEARVTTSGADAGKVVKGDEVTVDPLNQLDDALKTVDALRSDLGAIQNRFESAITNLNTNETNLAAARSRIEDADYAVEVANMTRAQILQQAGTSVLAQANQIPQNVLSLLG